MMKKILLAFCLLLSSNLTVQASEEVAIFKNGNAFFIKKINQEAKSSQVLIKNLPDALFGTIWFSSPNSNIKSVISETREESTKTKAINLNELLKSNTGKRIKIIFHSGENLNAVVENVEGDLLILKNKETIITTSVSQIKMVEFAETPNYDSLKKEEQRFIRINLKKPPTNSQNIDMMYMQGGIGWVPNYFVNLENDKKARISLNANIINDAEDLEDANINLVVGVPNFSYSYLKSPLTSIQNINEFLRALDYPNNYQARSDLSNIVSQTSNAYYAEDRGPANSPVPETSFESQEDLYFYRIANINLKKSSRANFELFNTEVNYESLYEVDLLGNQNKNIYMIDSENNSNNEVLPKVWHSIKLDNSSRYPFTTGTAMVSKNEKSIIKPISQDKINYTSIGDKAKLKLTVSPDVSVKPSEKEISRTENIHFKDSYTYDQLTIEGKIKIKNSKNQSIKLNISRLISGSLINSSSKWTNTILNIYQTQNKTNRVEWELNLNPDETKEINYKYSMYLRR